MEQSAGADGDNKRTSVTLRRGPTLNFQAKEERGGGQGSCLFWRKPVINGDNRRLSESGCHPKGGRAILLERFEFPPTDA